MHKTLKGEIKKIKTVPNNINVLSQIVLPEAVTDQIQIHNRAITTKLLTRGA